MALIIDPIIIILLVVITQSGHIPTALKVVLFWHVLELLWVFACFGVAGNSNY